MKLLKTLLIASFWIISFSYLTAQIKVFDNGRLIVGGIQPPLMEMQVIGNTFFSSEYESYSVNLSGPMIRGQNRFSSASSPDYTWYNNDRTGIYHPNFNMIGFTLGGSSKVLMTEQTTYFFHQMIGSDLRLKENVRNINNPLEILSRIEGRSYRLKTSATSRNLSSSKIYYGFVAQELEKTNPELVETIPEIEMKAVDYNAVIPILVESVKLLQKLIEEQKEEIRRLSERIDRLEEKQSPTKRSRQ